MGKTGIVATAVVSILTYKTIPEEGIMNDSNYGTFGSCRFQMGKGFEFSIAFSVSPSGRQHKEVALLRGDVFVPVDMWYQIHETGDDVLPVYTTGELKRALKQAEKFVRCQFFD
jgi:hypothetical protein